MNVRNSQINPPPGRATSPGRVRFIIYYSIVLSLTMIRDSLAFQASATRISTKFNTVQFSTVDNPERRLSILYSSTLGNGDMDDSEISPEGEEIKKNSSDSLAKRFTQLLIQPDEYKKIPPIQVEDTNLLLYDVFLIVNLSLSISFWVTHRLSFSFLPLAFNEGCLYSIFWIISGLYHGAFLMSAVDGHYGSTDERGGPKAAAALALNTYISATNMRLIFALVSAVIQHRQVGIGPIEELIPLEIGCGIALMASWRALHSFVTPRI